MNKDEIKDLLDLISKLIELLFILRTIVIDKSNNKKPKG